MIKVGAVVLNYKNYCETINCVNSLLKQVEVDLQIVIVENGSNNESGDALDKAFAGHSRVHIIINSDNLGYARGNNIGIKWLRESGLDFILVCNSDVEFSSTHIIAQMQKMCLDKVGVIIPIIRNLDGSIEMRAQYKKRLFTLRTIKALLAMKKGANGSTTRTVGNHNKAFDYLEPGIQTKYNTITGSVFALTPAFFQYYSGLYPRTFLYVEELATLLLIQKAGLLCAIAQTDDVIHKGAASTDASLKSGTSGKKKMVSESAKEVLKLALSPQFMINFLYRK